MAMGAGVEGVKGVEGDDGPCAGGRDGKAVWLGKTVLARKEMGAPCPDTKKMLARASRSVLHL